MHRAILFRLPMSTDEWLVLESRRILDREAGLLFARRNTGLLFSWGVVGASRRYRVKFFD